MVYISEEIDYAIFFLGSIITIFLLIYAIAKRILSFLNKISQLPDQIINLNQKYTNVYNEVQILKEKIYRIDGQMDICWRIMDKLVSD